MLNKKLMDWIHPYTVKAVTTNKNIHNLWKSFLNYLKKISKSGASSILSTKQILLMEIKWKSLRVLFTL